MGVCMYKPAMCGCVRVKGTEPFVVFSALEECLRCGKCSMAFIRGFASMSSGVVGEKRRRKVDPRSMTGGCVGRCFMSTSNLKVRETSIRPEIASGVRRVVSFIGSLRSGKCTCRMGKSICFSAGGFRKCKGLSGRGRSRLRTKTEVRMGDRGERPVSFIL